jgi:hypothetical protein
MVAFSIDHGHGQGEACRDLPGCSGDAPASRRVLTIQPEGKAKAAGEDCDVRGTA